MTGIVQVPLSRVAPCPGCRRPDPARVVFSRNSSGVQALLAQTARNGRFHGTLRPGVYLARAFTDHEGGGLCRPARLVRIMPGRTTHLRLICSYEIG